MAKSTQVILLERLESHGDLGEIVNVKPGFARNYLLPQGKALRASEANKAYFEAQKKELEAQNEKRRKQAEDKAKKLKELVLVLVRQAGDKGQLYGSISSRDISDALKEKGHEVGRSMVNLNTAVKEIGLFDVEIILHPEVRETIRVNVARNEEEAKIQQKTGKAIIAEEGETTDEVAARAEHQLEKQMQGLLEEDAYEAEKEKLAEEAQETEQEAIKEAAKELPQDADQQESSETVDEKGPESAKKEE